MNSKLGLIFFCLCIFSLPISLAHGGSAEEVLLGLINQARSNPIVTAEGMGIDTASFFALYPEMQGKLAEGLAPLSWNERLYLSAYLHSQDMVQHGYYDSLGQDGSTVAQRIAESGYAAKISGETVGMVAFANFLSPDEAMRILFERIFRDEFNRAPWDQNILHPDFTEIGIGLEAGAWDVDGNLQNVYALTCDFGTPMPPAPVGPQTPAPEQVVSLSNVSYDENLSVLELELLEMINQMRRSPLKVAAALEMDIEKLRAEFPQSINSLEPGMAPVTYDQGLYQAARSHAADIIENDYYSEISLDGKTVADRVRENGYDPIRIGENMRLLSSVEFVSLEAAARTNLEKIFKREVLSPPEDRRLLNPIFDEVGARFLFLPPQFQNEPTTSYGSYFSYLLVATFGKSARASSSAYLCGTVYQDDNQNGLFDFGEGASGLPVSIQRSAPVSFQTRTNLAGGFSVSLPADSYVVTVLSDGVVSERWVELSSGNQSIILAIETVSSS